MEGINTIDNVEDQYIKFRNALTESAQQLLPDVDRTTKQKLMTAPILQKMNQSPLAKGDDDLYNFLYKEIKQSCLEANEARLNEQCQLIEQPGAAHKTNFMHCQIKEVAGKKRCDSTTTCVEAKDGTIIMEKNKILDRCSEYIGELYDDNRGEMPVITTSSISPIIYQEVEYALKVMPMRKSPGPDDIVAEMLVAAGDMGIAELTKLSNMVYIQGGFPSELNKSIFITLPKVNGATKCEKHCTISLMSHITKLVLRIVINRRRGRTLQEVSPEQYGFMPDKGTRNAICVLKRLVQRSVEKQKDVYTCFIDYSKAFDTVKHDSLVELQQSLDVDYADTQLLTNLYWTQTAAVRCDKDLSEWMSSKQGV